MNTANFVGRMVKDPAVRTTTSGLPVARFTLAINRHFGRRDSEEENKADFIPCVAWQKRAQVIGRFCHKGSLVGVTGPMQSRWYQDRDGNSRNVVECRVDNIEFLSKKPAADYVPEEEIPF